MCVHVQADTDVNHLGGPTIAQQDVKKCQNVLLSPTNKFEGNCIMVNNPQIFFHNVEETSA